MYKILKAEKLSENIFLMDVHAPRVASHCNKSPFLIIRQKWHNGNSSFRDFSLLSAKRTGTAFVLCLSLSRSSTSGQPD